MELRLNLPFDYHVVAYVRDNMKNQFVIVERSGPHPFVTYRLEIQTSEHSLSPVVYACEHGFYTDTKSSAWANLLSRVSFGV